MQVKCTSCGANQDIVEISNCSYCGNEIIIEKALVFFESTMNSEVGNLIMIAEAAMEGSNYKEAIEFYNKAVEKQFSNSDAWLGKGIATVLSSTIGDIKTNEAISYWKNSIKFSTNQNAMQKRIATIINNSVLNFYPVIENHYGEFKDVKNSYSEFVHRFLQLELAMTFALSIDVNNIVVLENGYELCQKVLSAYSRKNNKSAQYRNLDSEAKKALIAMDSLIEKMTIPKELYEIEEKYVNALNEIVPNRNLIPAKILNEESEKIAEIKRDEIKIKKLEELKIKKKKNGNIGLGIGLAVSIAVIISELDKGDFNFGSAVMLLLIFTIGGYFTGVRATK